MTAPEHWIEQQTTCTLKRYLRHLHALRRQASPEKDKALLNLIQKTYRTLKERSYQCG